MGELVSDVLKEEWVREETYVSVGVKLGTRSAGIAAGNMVFTIRDVIHDELKLLFQFFSIFLSLFRFFSCDLRSLIGLQCLFLAYVWLQFHFERKLYLVVLFVDASYY